MESTMTGGKSFVGHEGETFAATHLQSATVVNMTISSVKHEPLCGEHSYSIVLQSNSTVALEQGMFAINFAEDAELFMVPIGANQLGIQYELIFN